MLLTKNLPRQVVGPISLLYVGQREFAVTHPHDNRISILGTDDVTTGIIIVIRHTGNYQIPILALFYSRIPRVRIPAPITRRLNFNIEKSYGCFINKIGPRVRFRCAYKPVLTPPKQIYTKPSNTL